MQQCVSIDQHEITSEINDKEEAQAPVELNNPLANIKPVQSTTSVTPIQVLEDNEDVADH